MCKHLAEETFVGICLYLNRQKYFKVFSTLLVASNDLKQMLKNKGLVNGASIQWGHKKNGLYAY